MPNQPALVVFIAVLAIDLICLILDLIFIQNGLPSITGTCEKNKYLAISSLALQQVLSVALGIHLYT